jgi:hypothetical protein
MLICLYIDIILLSHTHTHTHTIKHQRISLMIFNSRIDNLSVFLSFYLCLSV